MEFYFVNDLHVDFYIKRQSEKGFPSVAKYKRFLEERCLPAEVLCIAGDLANDHLSATAILIAATKLYSKVVYVFGNHDYAVFESDKCESTAEKIEKIQKFVASNTPVKTPTVFRLNNSKVNLDGVNIAGGIGMCDFDWSKQKFGATDDTFKQLWSHWFDGVRWKLPMTTLKEYVRTELDKLENVIDDQQDIIVTHFVPSIAGVAPQFEDDIYTGLFNFNSALMTKKMKDGAIWHFGHTHDTVNKVVTLENGNYIRLLNNSIGYPGELKQLSKIEKTQFRIDI